MITFYCAPSTASLVVHWLLLELSIPFEYRWLDLEKREHKSPEYLKINPAGVVPTIVIEGKAMREAAAIAMHLAEVFPGLDLVPPPGTPERAQYYQWMFFMANTLQPAYRAWFYPTEPAGEANAQAAQHCARQRIETAWEWVSAQLETGGPYMLGQKLSTVDFMATMLMRWSRNMARPTDQWPALLAHARRMKARPAFREVYAREGLTDWT